ncbi:MAG: Dabb family protein [Bacteroidales bacterium]|nr:Dabb family protein [Bacteroidales bacterium]
MIKHIVLFKLKPELKPEQIESIYADFRQAICALPATISCIRSIDVLLNINPSEVFHIALDATFDTLEDVSTYAMHPDHQSAAAKLRPYVEVRSCVDATI